MGDETKPVQVFAEEEPPQRFSAGEIVHAYLVRHGFGGMAGDGCGCSLDDLFACGVVNPDCSPGFEIVPARMEGRKNTIGDYYIYAGLTREEAETDARNALGDCAFCSAPEDDEGICDGSGCEGEGGK
jgi:hypothetical protein